MLVLLASASVVMTTLASRELVHLVGFHYNDTS